MMSNKKALLEAVAYAQRQYPNLRLGQLLSNIVKEGEDLFYIEDEELERRLYHAYPGVQE